MLLKPNMKQVIFYLVLFLGFNHSASAENGYRLWLRYNKVNNPILLNKYRNSIKQLIFPETSPTLNAARHELTRGLTGMLDRKLEKSNSLTMNAALLVGTPTTLKSLLPMASFKAALNEAGNEGYTIRTMVIHMKSVTVIASNTDIGVLYGVYNFLKLIQTEKKITNLSITDRPNIKFRLLDHWDNLPNGRDTLTGTIERGYAGQSLWDWAKLPQAISSRYLDYARADASIGINGAVLNNVNANAQILTLDYIKKAAAIANVFRPYGVKIFLSAKFNAPITLGGLKTADPLDPEVIKWWTEKIKEIYSIIPDFGGFLVKANSEGQPGPQTYGRGHAEGANMFADALAPHGGIVMWRAFVYDNKVSEDRTMQAYKEFHPLDGKFRPNVVIQVKNGPLDFQPREPFSPLFGGMPNTPKMLELQVTKEYLGDAGNLVFLAPMWKECLDSDTYASGKGTTVASVIEGKHNKNRISGIAGVSNVGNDTDWCGSNFAQANWYAYGRLAWRPETSSEAIADDWIRMTFNNDKSFIDPIKKIMLSSREAAVNYMTPIGLHHQMSAMNDHYGPGPWVGDNARFRADQTSTYFSRVDSIGLGFDRTSKTGSNSVGQYFEPIRSIFDNIQTTPEEYLLWFHHVPWTYKMKSGKTMWIELIEHYNSGIAAVKEMQNIWNTMQSKIDPDRFNEEKHNLAVQLEDAEIWKGACLLYYQKFSRLPIPEALGHPIHDLAYYQKLRIKDKRKLETEH
jgi:alpha-glucuronidase